MKQDDLCPQQDALRAPGQLRALVDAIGEACVFNLLEKRAGTRVYIPRKLTPSRGLAREIGLDAAQCKRLSEQLGDIEIKVPLCRPWRALVYRSQELSYAKIALKLGVTESAVHKYLQTGGMTHQMSLPL